ncbi:hypothetical protein PALB_10830 [Pseudoalteromonas luteoviolacea B = ATCC 29581]|nr:hypothetical protein PALB_10830 [Pseudoalteromonas luteoviolacea B = ATCC 29581]
MAQHALGVRLAFYYNDLPLKLTFNIYHLPLGNPFFYLFEYS